MIGVFGKLALNTGLDAFQLYACQYGIMTIIMGLWFVFTRPGSLRITRSTFLKLVLQGIIGTSGTTVFFYLAIGEINVGIASMLLFTYPVFVSIFFMVSGIRKISTMGKIALFFALIGSLLVLDLFSAGQVSFSWKGILFGILSSLCYAFYNTFADLKLSTIEPSVITFYTSVVSFVTGLIIASDILTVVMGFNVEMLGYLFMLAVISGILPVILIYRGISLIGADKASIVSSSELPITVILAFLFLGERMNAFQLSGMVLIVAAVILLHTTEPREHL
jgi:drug/metabolite transporter (DMT)-like permease